jgi:phospholipid/cholesterol/gamma-HCH transport system substrate-binding protein
VVVRLDLDKGLKIPDSDSTVASLFSTDFLGTKKIQLVLGHSDKYMKEGDTINTYFKKDLTEQIGSQIDPIIGGISNMVPKLDSTISGLSWLFDQKNPKGIYQTKGEIDVALVKLDLILAENQITIKTTLNNLQSITGNIEKNNAQITTILKNASNITDSIEQANLRQTIENLNATISQLRTLVSDLNEGQGTLGKVMKDEGLYHKVDSAVSNLNVLLKDVKERPYRYINISVFGQKKHEKRMEEKYNESGKPN